MLRTLLRDNPVVVTGMGCYSAAGDSVDALWRAAIGGRGLASWRDVDAAHNGPARFAVCGAPDMDPAGAALHPVRKMDRCVQMAWMAAREACRQADFGKAYPAARIGVAVGSSRGPVGKMQESFGSLARSRQLPSLAVHSTFASLSGALGQSFGFQGPGATLSATCASAAFAIGFAAEQILLGKADAMLAGGAEAPLQPSVLGQLHSTGVLGSDPSDVRRACRPFDVDRNGTVPGEGSAFLVLESARRANARGARPLARLAGWAMSLDDSGRTGVHEDGSGLLEAMAQALETAGIDAGEIDYVNAHGTATVLNDVAEAQAVARLFGDRAARLPCTSTKPVTGHCLGATAALEAVLCVEALRHQMVPPTANCFRPDPLCPINPQPMEPLPAALEAVMSTSLGFWGYRAALIFLRT